MVATATTPPRIPFDYGQFYNAMIDLVGRTPDIPVRHGLDGFYDFIYKPKNDIERREFPMYAGQIREWLDKYDITFSGSFCGYTKDWSNDGQSEVLRIAVKHPVTAETTAQAEALHCNVR